MLRGVVFGYAIFGRQVHCLFEKKISQFTNSSNEFDVVVVGGGIVGCATARQLQLLRPSLKIALMEKESNFAVHQSGHNSGVLHAGIYYQPGSLKAKLCVEGIDLAYEYLDKKKIPYKKCGKLIVAVEESELPKLDVLFERAKKNGCKSIEMIDSKRIQEIEPHCRDAIYANNVITCAGLQSDRVAQMSGCSALPKIMPFRGEYLYLKPEKHYLVKTNIYPVPDPNLPFLGVHFTPTINGEVLLGPNAVLAFKREGYTLTDFSFSDFFDSVSYSGFRKLAIKYFVFGIREMYRGIFISAQVKQLQRFIPELQRSDVTRGKAGVRAQALDEFGKLVDDFVFDGGEGPLADRLLHVRNAPSPGATSSLAIAKMVVDKAVEKFSI